MTIQDTMKQAIEILERELARMRARVMVWEDLCISAPTRNDAVRRATALHVYWGGYRERWGASDFKEWLHELIESNAASVWLSRYGKIIHMTGASAKNNNPKNTQPNEKLPAQTLP